MLFGEDGCLMRGTDLVGIFGSKFDVSRVDVSVADATHSLLSFDDMFCICSYRWSY